MAAREIAERLILVIRANPTDFDQHPLQLDEMWAWIYCKEKNRTEEIAKKHPDAGDVWLWVAVDADTKLVPTWFLGQRDYRTAKFFVDDLASRLRNRVEGSNFRENDAQAPQSRAHRGLLGDQAGHIE